MEGGNKMKTRLGGERNFRRFALITLGIMTILSLLPVILIGLVVGGLIYLAFPILIVVGIVGLLL